MTDRIHMTVAEARALGEAAMRGAGYDADDARILTDHVLDAALCGYEYSGLPKLLNVVDHPDFKRPRRPIAVLRETGATALLDGGNNTGMVAAYRASEATIARARSAWPGDRLPRQYVDDRAQCLLLRNDRARGTGGDPYGGGAAGGGAVRWRACRRSAPTRSLSDFRPRAIRWSSTWARRRSWRPTCSSEPGWGRRYRKASRLGRMAQPTTDAAAARRGTLLPFGGPEGGYKGFGLALAMDALGLLAAASAIRRFRQRLYVHRLQARPVRAAWMSTGAISASASRRSRRRRDRPGSRKSASQESAATPRDRA